MMVTPDKSETEEGGGSGNDKGKDSEASGSSSNDDDEDNNANAHDNVNLEIMMDRKLLSIKDLPRIGESIKVAYGDVKMPGKLYTTKKNIDVFVESKCVDEWKITKKWTGLLDEVDLKTVIEKKEVRSIVFAELEAKKKDTHKKGKMQLSFPTAYSIFSDYDGKKSKNIDILSNADRVFLNLLVGADEFGDTKTPDLVLYIKESRCHEETVRLLRKFDIKRKVDHDLIEKHFNPRPNRRFCEILIFISQFFGRAERVLGDSQVRDLWNTLLFMEDFLRALEDQSKVMKVTQETQQEVGSDQEDDLEDDEEKEYDRSSIASEQGNDVVKNPPGKRKKTANPVTSESKKQKWATQTRKQQEAAEVASSVVSYDNIVCLCPPLSHAKSISFLCTMVESLYAKKYVLPMEHSGPEARDRLRKWMNTLPTNDHVAKLITKEKMKVHYKKLLLNEESGELA
jgi:hypothetical protein